METFLDSNAPFDFSLGKGSKNLNQTLVVPLGYRDVAMEVFENGHDFHYVTVSGISESSTVTAISKDRIEKDRDFHTVPGGIVVVGRRDCFHTQAAVRQLIDQEMPFYYLDCGKTLSIIRKQLGDEKLSMYRFSTDGPADGLHSTVPIIFIGGKLIGGKTELSEALRENYEDIERDVAILDDSCKYFSLPADRVKVIEASKLHTVRIVEITK